MRKICYSVAMSLDGYIAGPGGERDWIVMDPEIDFAAMMDRFDAILMGRKTYDEARQMAGSGGGMPGMSSYVVSTTVKPGDETNVTVLNADLAQRLAMLKAEPGKDIWLFGGASLFRSLLELGVVDEVSVAVIPVLLGAGTPFLTECRQRQSLKLVSCKTYKKTGTVALEYRL